MRLAPAGPALMWLHLAGKSWHPSEHEYRLLLSETMAGRVWAGVVDDLPVAIGGVLVPRGDCVGTAWLSVLPGLEAATVLRAALLMRRVIRVAAAVHRPGVVCCIDDGNGQGARLGRALGFVRSERIVGSLREWRLDCPASAT